MRAASVYFLQSLSRKNSTDKIWQGCKAVQPCLMVFTIQSICSYQTRFFIEPLPLCRVHKLISSTLQPRDASSGLGRDTCTPPFDAYTPPLLIYIYPPISG